MSAPTVLTPGPFAQLLANPADLRKVAERLEGMIADSFEEDERRAGRSISVTHSEVRRRFAVCERWFRILRGDLGWGVQHALETLPVALRAELDGVPFDPAQRQTWVVPGSERLSELDTAAGDFRSKPDEPSEA